MRHTASWQSAADGSRWHKRRHEEATLQQHSTERACNDYVYFLNEDFFTQHFGDHWGGSVQDKKKVKKKHNSKPDNNMALSPMTLSQPQCSSMHKLATFSHVNQCEKTTALDREHFAVFVRIRRHWRKLAQPCLKANLSRGQEMAGGRGQIMEGGG